jgi:hypothetical protein
MEKLVEKFIYESRPYSYLALALWVFFRMHDSKLALVCGATLVFCGIYLVLLRRRFRQEYRS